MGQARRNLPRNGRRICVLLDGVRWDLWEYLKDRLFGPLSNEARLVQEGSLWARLPSSAPRHWSFWSGPWKRPRAKDDELVKNRGIIPEPGEKGYGAQPYM